MTILLLAGSPASPSRSARLLHYTGQRLALLGHRTHQLQVRDLPTPLRYARERERTGLKGVNRIRSPGWFLSGAVRGVGVVVGDLAGMTIKVTICSRMWHGKQELDEFFGRSFLRLGYFRILECAMRRGHARFTDARPACFQC